MPVNLTTAPLLLARQQLAAVIEAATGYPCHASFRPTFETPCYLLEGNGISVGTAGRVTYAVKVTAAYASQEGDHADAAEELARLAADACAAANLAVPTIPPPSGLEVTNGNGQVTTFVGVQFDAQMPVNIRE